MAGVVQCWTCDAMNRIVTLSGCGHHFCMYCLENQHSDWTAGCKQPCQQCFRLNVPPRSDLRNLKINPGIPNIAALNLQARIRPAGEDQPLDKLRPCKVMGSSNMTTESLREKILLLGIKAMEKFDDYYKRAKYISDELDREEAGYWGCSIMHEDVANEGRASTCFTYFENNTISFRIGECRFTVQKQSN